MFPRLLAVSVALGIGVGAAQTTAPPPVDVTKLKIAAPATIRDLDVKGARGVPTRLAWAPDGTALYIRVSQFDRWANESASHALVNLAARTSTSITGEPPWAPRYWLWKSAPASPSDPAWRLVFTAWEEQVRTTNVPRGGDIGGFMADAGAGYDELAQKAVLANQKARFERLTLNGRVVDETVNTQLIPGRRFGWAPASRPLIAVADRDGRLVLVDRHGRAATVAETRNVLLPAWSEDGSRIAFIERVKGDKYVLRLVRLDWPMPTGA
jgi:hypothetical protein